MSTTALKITALVLMTIDHIGRFIPGTSVILRIIGRASRPLFAFCAVQGLHHTSDKGRYLERLYVFSVFTGVMNYVLNSIYPAAYHPLTGNIFSSLFVALFIINSGLYGGELMKIVFMTIFNLAVHSVVSAFFPDNVLNITGALFPEMFHSEGSILFFIMVLMLNSGKESRKDTVLCFGGYCFTYLLLVLLANTSIYTTALMPLTQLLFRYSIQWLQVMALPLMLMYNGKKGMGLKYLFYIYYPLHIMVLFILSNTVFI